MCSGKIKDALMGPGAKSLSSLSSGGYDGGGGFASKAMGAGLAGSRMRKRIAKLPQVPLLGLSSLGDFTQPTKG